VNVTRFDIPDLLLIEPQRFGDARGWFSEVWQATRYHEAGIKEDFVQDNLARSVKGVLRGLHAQQPHAQGKLVQVFSGRVFDVAVDLRVGSPTFGRWESVELDGDIGAQYYVPPGFAHGYCVLSDEALFGYKTTDIYSPESELSVRWNDPDIGIDWPLVSEPTLSDRDRVAPLLADVPESRLIRY
jgi:dTDP-4-dehydrorhamnose 3,5-epimerase|tara:strand:+ start:845 stop:1399 length:555 start_codon:yes stop_codon:yes gene_type:complete